MTRTSRMPATLADSLHRQLSSYALAASAAGVGIIALTQAAEARIVYTPANVNLRKGFGLDLTRDGSDDFVFKYGILNSTRPYLAIEPMKSKNQIWGSRNRSNWASALASGMTVGPNLEKFGNNELMYYFTPYGGYGFWYGNQIKAYLGLEFHSKGKVHYGWARVTGRYPPDYSLRLKGYAYETIPNKPIIAGKTKGPDVITVQLGSLGALAAGASGPRK